jgi:hypothetical protein
MYQNRFQILATGVNITTAGAIDILNQGSPNPISFGFGSSQSNKMVVDIACKLHYEVPPGTFQIPLIFGGLSVSPTLGSLTKGVPTIEGVLSTPAAPLTVSQGFDQEIIVSENFALMPFEVPRALVFNSIRAYASYTSNTIGACNVIADITITTTDKR